MTSTHGIIRRGVSVGQHNKDNYSNALPFQEDAVQSDLGQQANCCGVASAAATNARPAEGTIRKASEMLPLASMFLGFPLLGLATDFDPVWTSLILYRPVLSAF